jgi:hypothetical protein
MILEVELAAVSGAVDAVAAVFCPGFFYVLLHCRTLEHYDFVSFQGWNSGSTKFDGKAGPKIRVLIRSSELTVWCDFLLT